MWPHGQAVKTPPFHGGNMGSSPVGVTTETSEKQLFSLVFASYSGYFGSLPPIFPQNNKNKKSFFVRLAAAFFFYRHSCRSYDRAGLTVPTVKTHSFSGNPARIPPSESFRILPGADPALFGRRRAYSFYKKSFAIYNCITVPKMSSSAVRTVSALCFYNVIIKLPFL